LDNGRPRSVLAMSAVMMEMMDAELFLSADDKKFTF
jgi:hypothetical protein